MKVNRIDINKTINFFFKNDDWWKIVLVYGLFAIGVLGIFFLFYFILIIALFGSMNVYEVELGNKPIVALIFIFIYILFLLIIYTILFYIHGVGINNYLHLIRGNKDEYKLSEYPKFGIISNVWSGFKLVLTAVPYYLPLIAIYVVWLIIFMGKFSDSIVSNNEPTPEFLMFYVISILGLSLFQLIYMFSYANVLKPIVFRIVSTEGFLKASNPIRLFSEFAKNPKEYLINGFISALPYILWFALYIVTVVLVYLCIGIFLFPFVYSFFFVILTHIEPHMIWQVNNQK